MRTLSWISRAFAAAAALVAVILIVGGSYFIGFVSEVQRGLSDPASASLQAATQIAAVEQTLGYGGFLKAYRTYRATGDIAMHEQMTRHAMESARTLDRLRKLYTDTPAANRALNDAASVVEAFADVARTAPELGPTALRGSDRMNALESLPQVPQLEATYLTLRTALERLRSQTQAHQMGSVAWALSWSQMLIVAALALLVIGLLAAAGLLQLGITQPIKSLERSLTSVGDGQVSQPVWGTERTDEIGTLARAGEKLRRSLTETEALKSLAEKGELHIRLDGGASVLLEKLASGVTTATQALKTATTELSAMQGEQRQHIDEAVQRLGQYGFKFEEAAGAIRTQASHAISSAAENMHASMTVIVDTASERTQRLAHIGGQFEHNAKQLAEAVATIKEKTGNAVDGITSSIIAFRKAADGAQTLQGALFAACDKISSDATSTAANIKDLATQLHGVVGHVDGRLTSKLNSLEALEKTIEAALGTIQIKALDTIAAMATAASTLEQHNAAAEARADKSVEHFEDVVRLFREDLPVQPQAPDFNALASGFHQQLETIRSEVRELAMRITEERIMMTADMPAANLPHSSDEPLRPSHRTLADVPINEIMQRLKNLTEEMNAGAETTDPAFALKSALGAFAHDVKALDHAEPDTLSNALARHAEAIDASAGAVEPSAIALRAELQAITSELRIVANTAHDPATAHDSALHLGARAESLFSYLTQTHSKAFDEQSLQDEETMEQTTSDLATLAKIIGKIEARASQLSDSAVAASLDQQFDTRSPSEFENSGSTGNDGTITTVFESIERLNNIAASLARAGDAERLRKAAH